MRADERGPNDIGRLVVRDGLTKSEILRAMSRDVWPPSVSVMTSIAARRRL
jgi:hypothetical protein